MSFDRKTRLLVTMPSSVCHFRFLESFSSSSFPNRRVGDGDRGSEARGSLKRDCGERGCRLTAEESKLPSILRLVGRLRERLDRGVKKRPKRRGVTEGFRFSFRRLVRDGDMRPLTGDEVMMGGGGLDVNDAVLPQ